MEILLIEMENINYMLDKISKELLKELTPEQRKTKLKQYDFLEARYRQLEQIIREANYESDFNNNINNDRHHNR